MAIAFPLPSGNSTTGAEVAVAPGAGDGEDALSEDEVAAADEGFEARGIGEARRGDDAFLNVEGFEYGAYPGLGGRFGDGDLGGQVRAGHERGDQDCFYRSQVWWSARVRPKWVGKWARAKARADACGIPGRVHFMRAGVRSATGPGRCLFSMVWRQ